MVAGVRPVAVRAVAALAVTVAVRAVAALAVTVAVRAVAALAVTDAAAIVAAGAGPAVTIGAAVGDVSVAAGAVGVARHQTAGRPPAVAVPLVRGRTVVPDSGCPALDGCPPVLVGPVARRLCLVA